MQTSYTLDADDIIRAVNPAWDRFAIDNDAPDLVGTRVVGRSLWELVTDEVLSRLYRQVFQQVRQSGRELTLPYRCDSPDQQRFMQMTIRRSDSNGTLTIVSAVLETVPLPPDPETPPSGAIVIPELVKRCSVCNRWHLRGDWMDIQEVFTVLGMTRPQPTFTVHTVCDDCLAGLQGLAGDPDDLPAE